MGTVLTLAAGGTECPCNVCAEIFQRGGNLKKYKHSEHRKTLFATHS